MASSSSSKLVIHVCGWTGCPWYQRAAHIASSLSLLYPTRYGSELHESATRDEFREQLASYRSLVPKSEAASQHESSPFVYAGRTPGESTFVGGCDATVEWARGLLRPAARRLESRTVDDGFREDHGFEYDVVVIGGGSGGLACSQECARLGAKVAVVDFVKPSPAGSRWGLGGTCVNVGCIPKKLMHASALAGEAMRDDAAAFGWDVARRDVVDWGALRTSVQNHIKGLNFEYRVALREAGIDYLNRLAAFEDAHALEVRNAKGETSTITAARFVVAVGGRPSALPCEGAEHAVDSDDIFSSKKPPGRTLCVGGGYVALECAGFLAGLGYPVTCMVRSVALRGFDRECVSKITDDAGRRGIAFQTGRVPTKIEKVGDVLRVTDSTGDTAEYDTVLAAVGRRADAEGLRLENVPGASESLDARTGKLKDEQLPGAPHVYAIGDVLEGRPELTPVAIEAGRRLARRLFGGGVDEPVDYDYVPTTVFTPLEFGTVGLTEDQARAECADLEVYVSEFAPLEHALSEARAARADRAFAKLLVDKADGTVLGFHYLGPNAGEVTQGFAVAMRCGATYDDFISTIGIHPTNAEEFCDLTITKASGLSPAKAGC
ncbi:hypothetical protein CTAYLR_010260 [Chrysophaeum taylorii]|uniref:Thioredoxin reductase n=1 Tax=Chrysophaeum taylorii TaxID=2483200 RepID=A0AAD7UJ22_9STRA|nr:hypothetical protein CTAYLR_010260 [Chrysophaeum taylorii]